MSTSDDKPIKSPSEFAKKYAELLGPVARAEFIEDLGALMRPPEDKIWMEAIITPDLRPIVNCRMGDYSFQVGPEQARQLGRNFFEIANFAEGDAFIFDFFSTMHERSGLPKDPDVALQLLHAFRQWRDQRSAAPVISTKTQ